MVNTILHQSSLAQTHQGRKIEVLRWTKPHSKGNQDQPLLFIGGLHGDEPEGVRLAQDLIAAVKDLLSGSLRSKSPHHSLSSLLIIPCINPDGYQNNLRTNARGVDLNRNFPTEDWSPEGKGTRYDPGPQPQSEIETQALVQLIEHEKPKRIFHFHSWNPCIVYTGSPGKQEAQILSRCSGFPAQESIGYPTPGSLGDYGWRVHGIPVICIEAPEITKPSDLDLLWPLFGPGLIEILTPERE